MYTLSFTPTIDYPVNSTITLKVPTTITPGSSLTCQRGSTNYTCTTTSNLINITVPESLTANQSYSISISPLTNPRNQTQTAAFVLSSYTSGYLVESSSVPGISTSQANSIKALSITVVSPSQSYYSSNQSIRFTVTTTNPLYSTDYMEITYPSSYTAAWVGNSSICT